ncbi:MAG: hypothetical protein ACKV2T_36420 [Kofleriaceae bacterium]
MATFLLFLCIAAGCGVLGILFMLYGPTRSSVRRIGTSLTPSYDIVGFSLARPPPPARFDGFVPPARFDGIAEGSAPIAPPTMFVPIAHSVAPPASFVPIAHSLSTDFSVEEPVQEVRIRAKVPSPPPLPPVTPLPPPPLPAKARLPKAAHAIAPVAHIRAEATPTTPPRLGVSAPSARARHLEPPRRMPPLPRSRSARGSDAPPVPSFAMDNQRTAPRELDEFSTAEHTFVD